MLQKSIVWVIAIVSVTSCTTRDSGSPSTSLGASGTRDSTRDSMEVARVRAAAEKGDATAQHDLGVRYFTGNGVDEDFGQAAAWMQKAANQGFAPAEYDLGEMYRIGLGEQIGRAHV